VTCEERIENVRNRKKVVLKLFSHRTSHPPCRCSSRSCT